MLAKLAMYPTFQVFLTTAAGFLMTALVMPMFIKLLKAKKIGQQVRFDGPQGHLIKEGTPTMGGLMILVIVTVVFSVLIVFSAPSVDIAGAKRVARYLLGCRDAILVLATTLACGLLGFIDDGAKVAKERSLGLSASAKIAGQILIAVLFVVLAVNWAGVTPDITVPATTVKIPLDFATLYLPWVGGGQLMIPPLYLLFAGVMVVGLSNAVNLTDGLDGLAAGTVAIVVLVFAAIAYSQNNLPVSIISGAIAGSCFGFLWFNAHPADIFMGDTGSLGLGGGIAALAAVTKTELLVLIIGGIFVIEALSVVIQVAWYKKFKKRVFKMAPIHHHFEMIGWSETKIMVRFWIITAVLAGLGFAIYFFQTTRLG